MLSLEEKRAALQAQLGALDGQLDTLKRQLVSGVPAPAPKPVPAKAAPAKKAPTKAKRVKLKARIFAALTKAGAAGVKVLDIARALGTSPANIYAWFHAAETRYPAVKKVGPATYRLETAAAAPASRKPAAAKPAKPAVPAKPAPKAKPAQKPEAKTASGGNARGELQARILEALKTAGSAGETIKSLAAKFKMPYRNIQVWFATTGKRNPAVKKVGPGVYQFAG